MFIYPNRHRFKVSPLSEAHTTTEVTIPQIAELLIEMDESQMEECIILYNSQMKLKNYPKRQYGTCLRQSCDGTYSVMKEGGSS